LLSGGLRYAATTGYYLTALQAEPPLTALWYWPHGTVVVLRASAQTASLPASEECLTRVCPGVTLPTVR
jgi:hypothetical protein